jgi:glycerate-2-kinase
LRKWRSAKGKKLAPGERLCLVSGGETTVRVTGKGKGGRNQELALAFARAIEGKPGITFLSAGTDGIDGPTDAAGGVVDGGTATRAKEAGLDPGRFLADNDAYTLLDACGGLLKTGPTGTNVMDLQIALLSG